MCSCTDWTNTAKPIHVQFAQFKKNLLWWNKLPTPWLAITCLLDKSTGGTGSHHHLRPVSQNGLPGTMRLNLPLQEVKCLLVPASLLLSLLNTIHLGPQTRGVLWINIATLPPSCKKQKQLHWKVTTVWHWGLECYIPTGLHGHGEATIAIKETNMKPTASMPAQALPALQKSTFHLNRHHLSLNVTVLYLAN